MAREKISNDFKKIVIYGDNGASPYKTKFQTSAKHESGNLNNGIDINKMKWNWIYYLPGEIAIDKIVNDITIRFKMELHETTDGRTYNSSTLKEDMVLFEKTYSNSLWNGDVFKYSMEKHQSVLDDIYNNAQN